jgi:hypothetical protein
MSHSAKRLSLDLRPILGIFVLLSLMTAAPVAEAAAPTAEQKDAICGSRASCKITQAVDAGKDDQGKALTVVELHLALADKPAEAPEEGCNSDPDSESKDGGVEYWLLRASDAPRQLMSLCNDGYGAAGVGEDDVTIKPNRLIHGQSGGSAWRWDSVVTYSLSPFRELRERSCSFNTVMPNSGTVLDLDMRALQARSLAWQGAAEAASDDDGEMGCPDWPDSLDRKFVAQPTADSVAAYVIPAPLGSAADPIAPGTVLGNCSLELSTDGRSGFLVFGKPAGSDTSADIRVMAQGYNELLLQLYDPTATKEIEAAKGKSWVQAPHFEIWTAVESQSADETASVDYDQLGVGLDGKLYPGAGKPAGLPAVERWSGTDEQGRAVQVVRLHWDDQWAFMAGVGVVYSQSLEGKQMRLISTAAIVKNHPLFLPTVWAHQPEDSGEGGAHCAVEGMILTVQP